ncbi:hypothetical protein V8F33_008497 [Rhypophila sp. PSN 637]
MSLILAGLFVHSASQAAAEISRDLGADRAAILFGKNQYCRRIANAHEIETAEARAMSLEVQGLLQIPSNSTGIFGYPEYPPSTKLRMSHKFSQNSPNYAPTSQIMANLVNFSVMAGRYAVLPGLQFQLSTLPPTASPEYRDSRYHPFHRAVVQDRCFLSRGQPSVSHGGKYSNEILQKHWASLANNIRPPITVGRGDHPPFLRALRGRLPAPGPASGAEIAPDIHLSRQASTAVKDGFRPPLRCWPSKMVPIAPRQATMPQSLLTKNELVIVQISDYTNVPIAESRLIGCRSWKSTLSFIIETQSRQDPSNESLHPIVGEAEAIAMVDGA